MYSVKFADGSFYGAGGCGVRYLRDASKWEYEYACKVAARHKGATVVLGKY